MNKSMLILDLIERSGGMRFTDIQRELWRMSHGQEPFTSRGYWCLNLIASGNYGNRKGLLKRFCYKGSDGLWRRKLVAHFDQPWKSTNDGG